MLLDDCEDWQRTDINLSVLKTLIFINQRSAGTPGRHRGADGAGWNTSRAGAGASFDLARFGRKRVSQADAILCGRGAGRHQRADQIISAHAQRLGLSVLPRQELDLDLGVLLASPPLPGRCVQSGPL